MTQILEVSSGGEATPDRPSILVLKVDHRGDLVTAVPALEMLRKLAPDAHITLVVSSWNEPFARELGIAEEILILDAIGEDGQIRSSPSDLTALLAADRRYDLALDLRVDPDTRFLLRGVPSALKCGFSAHARHAFLDLELVAGEAAPPPREQDQPAMPFRVHDLRARPRVVLGKNTVAQATLTCLWSDEDTSGSGEFQFEIVSHGLAPLSIQIEITSSVALLEKAYRAMTLRLPYGSRAISVPVKFRPGDATGIISFFLDLRCWSGCGSVTLSGMPWPPEATLLSGGENALPHRSEQQAALVAASVQRLRRGAMQVRAFSS